MKNDRQLQRDIIAALEYSPAVAAEHIGVAVQDGVVTLTGEVSSYAEKYAAERACFRVHGVKAVADSLEVKLPGTHVRSDTDIARAAADALAWNVLVPASVQVSVENGRVILRGHVDWDFQRNAAEKALRNLTGITELVNHISIEKGVEPLDVKKKIEEALQRMAADDAQNIGVEISGSKVILTGTVQSLAESEDVKWAAWAVPGVSDVENRLRISEDGRP
ncbi:MAG TPA: BON domain-containing protein [Oligoflexus sp.]|uniref:BON domain-containing protein n=1 Tax=Oligoflexus sp. TaxID=1971216 RepID=UPI002D7ECEA2|nr:BON domain-containing protein [Oligoflexus sp.]HET9238633.1 BON domain-containing protein [Oligoflexus sp.]